jgi:hypothetical protein
MLNVLAWLLFGSPLIVTSILMARSAAKRRADVNTFRAQPRVDIPRNLNNDRYFSNSRNRDRSIYR